MRVSIRRQARFVGPIAAIAMLTACGASKQDAASSKYPPRPEGCAVEVFPEAPLGQTDNIGTVRAICGDDIKKEDCMRTLKDQACKLGADVVWGITEEESSSIGKKHLSGRAAHTKAAKP